MSLVSVVTVNYNNALGLAATIDSVKSQINSGASLEHIIIDGGSDDEFWDVVDAIEYENVVIVSEPDSGIYDAMNKGVAYSKGDSVVFVNSGDYFFSGFDLSLLQTAYDLKQNIVCCYTLQVNPNDVYLRPSAKKHSISYADIGHQGIFCPRTILLEKSFDLDFLVRADSEWKKCILKFNEWIFCPQISTVFSLGGVSSSFRFADLVKIYRQPGGWAIKTKATIKSVFSVLVGRDFLYRVLYYRKYDRIRRDVFQLLAKKQ